MRAALALAAAALLATLGPAGCRRHPLEPEPGPGRSPSPVKILYPSAPGSFVKLVERLRPSVVSLSTTGAVKGGPADWFPTGAPGEGLPSGEQTERLRRSLGTGFLVDGHGSVVTSAHLLGKDRELRVRLEDGSELVARVVGQDPASDLAVLKIDPPAGAHLVPLRFGDSDQLQVGEWVVALGNPFGVGVTVSAGVLSARERRDLPRGESGYLGLLQTDARIHPGNAGGPLVNLLGEVVGVNTAISAETQGVGFAVPGSLVQKLLPMLRRDGKVVRAWVGIYMDKVTQEVAARAGLKKPQGALVRQIVAGGPAERAGLRTGDIILAFDGREVSDAGELPTRAALAGVNRVIPIRVWRDGKAQAFSLRTERMPE